MTEEEPATDVVRRDRFSGGPARGFLSSMDADSRIFAADLAVDRAHVVMLEEQGIVDEESAGQILSALDAVEDAGFPALPGDAEDVHAAVETAVVDRVGEAGGRMHTARSRNDEVSACIRYRLREDLLDAVESTLALREALLASAAEHTGTVMPGYTHLQPAQPTTVAHWLCSYESAARRDTARLLDAYGRVNRSPLGAAAFAGTPYPVDRGRVAELLGFNGVVENSADAASARDFALESVGALVGLSTSLSGLAEDVVLFANHGFVALSDDYASTSSIMPQKKNPDTLELVRAAAGDAVGAYAGLATTLKGLPRAYNRDLQSATPHVWAAVDAVTEATAVAAGAVATAGWDEDALAAAAGEGFATATGVADLLATNGVPFRRAHEVVATAAESIADASGAGDSDDEAYDALDAAARAVLEEPLDAFVDREAVESALDPAESVRMRDSAGGPAPDAVASAIEGAEDDLAADRAALADRRDALAAAAEALSEEVSART